jgi:hypothetical protein
MVYRIKHFSEKLYSPCSEVYAFEAGECKDISELSQGRQVNGITDCGLLGVMDCVGVCDREFATDDDGVELVDTITIIKKNTNITINKKNQFHYLAKNNQCVHEPVKDYSDCLNGYLWLLV